MLITSIHEKEISDEKVDRVLPKIIKVLVEEKLTLRESQQVLNGIVEAIEAKIADAARPIIEQKMNEIIRIEPGVRNDD